MSSVKSYQNPSSFSMRTWATSQLDSKSKSTRVNPSSLFDTSDLSLTCSLMIKDMKKRPSLLRRIFHRNKNTSTGCSEKTPLSPHHLSKISRGQLAAKTVRDPYETSEEVSEEVSALKVSESLAPPTAKLRIPHGSTHPLAPTFCHPMSTIELSQLSKIYTTTLAKLKAFSQEYTMNRYLSMCRLLVRLQQSKDIAPLLQHLQHLQHLQQHPYRTCHLDNEFTSLLARADAFCGSSRKPRRTRYVFMLLETPTDRIRPNVHPIQEATRRRRKPYANTAAMITRVQDTCDDEPPTALGRVGFSPLWLTRKTPRHKTKTWRIVKSPVSDTVAQTDKSMMPPHSLLPNSVASLAKYSRTPVSPLLDLSSPASTLPPRRSKQQWVVSHHGIWTPRSESHLRSNCEEHNKSNTEERQDDDIPLGLLQANLPRPHTVKETE